MLYREVFICYPLRLSILFPATVSIEIASLYNIMSRLPIFFPCQSLMHVKPKLLLKDNGIRLMLLLSSYFWCLFNQISSDWWKCRSKQTHWGVLMAVFISFRFWVTCEMSIAKINPESLKIDAKCKVWCCSNRKCMKCQAFLNLLRFCLASLQLLYFVTNLVGSDEMRRTQKWLTTLGNNYASAEALEYIAQLKGNSYKKESWCFLIEKWMHLNVNCFVSSSELCKNVDALISRENFSYSKRKILLLTSEMIIFCRNSWNSCQGIFLIKVLSKMMFDNSLRFK